MAETFGMVAIQACRATAWPAETATRTPRLRIRAASNPHTFPKFQADLGRIIPLRDMINWCITTPQAGKALDVNSDSMVVTEVHAF
jgi:cytochrome c